MKYLPIPLNGMALTFDVWRFYHMQKHSSIMSTAVVELGHFFESMLALQTPDMAASEVNRITQLFTANIRVRDHPRPTFPHGDFE
jgi:hypothetical protein